MTAADAKGAATLANALVRLETLTLSLDKVSDPDAREGARQLFELLLDLHGLALAWMMAAVAADANSAALVKRLIADSHIRAILLLHGLHPHDAEARLRQALERMHLQWSARGFRVDLMGVSTGLARVRLHKNGNAEPADLLCQEVEDILVDAAPDLNDIVVEIDAAPADAAAAISAG